MLKFSLKSLKEGRQEMDLEAEASVVCAEFPEFVDLVRLHCIVDRVGRRFHVHCHAECEALLQCDYSLKDFREPIVADFDIEYVVDTDMHEQQRGMDAVDIELRALHEDESAVDLSLDVCQELAVRLPLKRIAPEYRDKPIEDILGSEFLDDGKKSAQSAEETWAALKNIKLGNN